MVSFTDGTLLNIFVHIESLALFILFYVLSDSFMFFSMSSNVIEAQKMLPGHPAFAASVSMGVAWATGYLLHLGYSSFFGNQVGFVLNSIGIFLSYHSRMFTDILSLLWESTKES